MTVKDQYLSTDEEEYVIDEEKFSKGTNLRQENELFDDNSYVPHDVVSVRRIEFAEGEDWEVLKNKKTVIVLKGVRFSAKERAFFRTIDGVKFIMEGFKSGWNSIAEFKKNLKVS